MTNRTRFCVACLAWGVLAGSALPSAAAEQQARMVDGSHLTLKAVFTLNRSGAWRNAAPSKLPARKTLTIWTTRTGITGADNVFTRAVVLDDRGKDYPLVYTGGVFQGPTPTEWEEQWVLMPAPPPADTLRLRISLAGKRPEGSTVELIIPYTEQWKARQFAGKTPDQWMADAVARWDQDLIRELLRLGARPHVRDGYGYTPLMVAAFTGDIALARTLLDQGAARDSRNRAGATALFYAILFGGREGSEMVELLLSRGSDPNLGSPALGTPLGWAAQYGKSRMVAALLSHGARPSAAVLQVAREREHWPVVRLLQKALDARPLSAN